MARKAEEVTAINHGGRGTPMSGSGSVKNDVRTGAFSIEVKSTTRKTYSLAYSTWFTAETHALRDGLKPAMVVSFDRGLGLKPKRLVVLDEDDFLELVENGTTS